MLVALESEDNLHEHSTCLFRTRYILCKLLDHHAEERFARGQLLSEPLQYLVWRVCQGGDCAAYEH